VIGQSYQLYKSFVIFFNAITLQFTNSTTTSLFNSSAKAPDKQSGEGTVVTKSTRGSSTKNKRREKEDSKSDKTDKESKPDQRQSDRDTSRRRRRRTDSDSEDEIVIDEEALWEQREKRREERRNKKKSKDETTTKLSNLTEEERADLEREQDKRERDEFAKRLLEKDKKKQRDLDENDDDSTQRKEKEAQRMERLKKREDRDRRLARGEAVTLESDDEADESINNKKKKSISISDMRQESRRAYLQKRTKRELELLERELQDEEEIIAKLGGSSKMTREETRELQLKRDILRMAREHGHVENDEAEAAKKPDGFYRLPDDMDEDETGKKKTRAQKGEELLTSRYVEPKQEKSEQQLWEEGQTQMAAGLARHKKKRAGGDEEDEDKYDFVFEEEQIDFVCVDTNKGYDNRKKKLSKNNNASLEAMDEEDKVLEMRPATKHEKILEGRKKLPVYPYR
jgi:pre-mRNA-splicing factor ATP-dependent RNA helicase DHX16